MRKRALTTGITGQDSSYLAQLLLEKGYEVHPIKRRASSLNTQRVAHLYVDPHESGSKFQLHYGGLTACSKLTRIIAEVQPGEVYNLGAQSHVAVSSEAPEYTADDDGMGTLRLLEALRFPKRPAFTRPVLRSCAAWCRRRRRQRPHRFTCAAPMAWQSFTRTRSP